MSDSEPFIAMGSFIDGCRLAATGATQVEAEETLLRLIKRANERSIRCTALRS